MTNRKDLVGCSAEAFSHGRRLIPWIVLLIGLASANGCTVTGQPAAERAGPAGTPAALNEVVSAAFGPNHRLWRAIPAEDALYVDFSSDYGVTFSPPVAVGVHPQRIEANSEDRPAIAADGKGRVFVLYAADGPLPWSTYFSYSSDGGRHFSTPILVSDQAEHAKNHNAALALGPSDTLYLFWNDEREHAGAGETGVGTLYFAAWDPDEPEQLINRRIKGDMCECCRLAPGFSADGDPLVLGRFVFSGSMRDPGLAKISRTGSLEKAWRVSVDDWEIQACPEHGPALAVADDGRYHAAWFTQGSRRQGLYYANSDDEGENFSEPMAFGDGQALAAHADVLAMGPDVFLAWKEFDGETTRILVMESADRGATWAAPRALATTREAADFPFLLSDGRSVFLSWNSADHGYRLVPVKPLTKTGVQ